jgi:hypothetical protein
MYVSSVREGERGAALYVCEAKVPVLRGTQGARRYMKGQSRGEGDERKSRLEWGRWCSKAPEWGLDEKKGGGLTTARVKCLVDGHRQGTAAAEISRISAAFVGIGTIRLVPVQVLTAQRY